MTTRKPTYYIVYLLLLFLLLWWSLIWIAAASWVWAVWGRRGGGGRGGRGRAVIVAVTAAVAVIRRGAGGVAAVWRWVTGRAIWITAAVAGVFSPESKWWSTKGKSRSTENRTVLIVIKVSRWASYSLAVVLKFAGEMRRKGCAVILGHFYTQTEKNNGNISSCFFFFGRCK